MRRRSGTRRNIRRRQPRPTAVVVAGLAVCAVVGLFVWVSEHADNGLPFLGYRTVNVSLPNIGSLKLHDQVRLSGVQVGQVAGTTTRHGRAIVKLQLQGVGPLPASTTAAIRANGLLGSSYVQLIPGAAGTPLRNGATIKAGPDSLAVGVPSALDLFDRPTRDALGDMVRGAGTGLLGRGTQLNQAIHDAPSTLSDLTGVAHSVLRAPSAAARLFPDVSAGMAALDNAREDIVRSFAPGAATLRPFVDQRAAVDRALTLAPTTLSDAQSGLTTGERLLASVETVGDAANLTLSNARPGLNALDALMRDAPRPLHRAQTLLREIPPTVPDVLRILASVRPDLTPLQRAFTNLLGPVTNLGQHGCDIKDFGASWRGVFGVGAAPGGPLGPISAFREIVVPTSQALAPIVHTPPYPDTQVYERPCKFYPGPTYSTLSPSIRRP